MKFIGSLFFTLVFFIPALSQTPRIVTAAQANGTYRYRQNEIKNLPKYLGYGELSDLQRRVLDETDANSYGPSSRSRDEGRKRKGHCFGR